MAFDDAWEVMKSRFDIFDAAVMSPMSFGGEVDDERGRKERRVRMDEHLSKLHFAGVACVLVRCIIFEVLRLKLPRQSAPHHPHAVHWIHDGFDLRVEEISARNLHNNRYSKLNSKDGRHASLFIYMTA